MNETNKWDEWIRRVNEMNNIKTNDKIDKWDLSWLEKVKEWNFASFFDLTNECQCNQNRCQCNQNKYQRISKNVIL